MGTMFHSDNTGVLVLLVGMIVLVMFGVFLTLLMDGSVRLGGREQEQRELRVVQENRIAALEAELEHLGRQRAERAAGQKQAARLQAVRQELAAASDSVTGLESELRTRQQELAALRDEYARVRGDFRKSVWISAVGTELDELATNVGRTYRDVIIRSIDARAVFISHSGGSGRIAVAELPADFREKYRLDLAEAARLEKEERERMAEDARRKAEERRLAEQEAEEQRRRMDERRRRTGAPSPEELAKEEENNETIRALRVEVGMMHEALLTLDREVAEAQRQIGGRDRSPPGSLETWEDRHRRLSLQADRARVALRVKETELEALDPTYDRRRSSRRR